MVGGSPAFGNEQSRVALYPREQIRIRDFQIFQAGIDVRLYFRLPAVQIERRRPAMDEHHDGVRSFARRRGVGRGSSPSSSSVTAALVCDQ